MEKEFLQKLDKLRIRFMRILWCDNANLIRGKAVHRRTLSDYLNHGVGISAIQQAVPVMYDAPVAGSGLESVGEIRLVPDWNTLTPLPYTAGHARVIGDMVLDGSPWSVCPRNFLKRIVADAKQEGLEVIAAFENKFYLLRRAPDGIVPADETVFASTLAMDLHQELIDDIAEALIEQRILVEQYYPESGSGQHKISVLYSDALGAADQQIAFRETVRAIALQHGLIASFLPKIFANQPDSACHLHLSLWQNGENLLPHPDVNGELSGVARCFIAGIINHLPALMALTAPSTNSYRRLLPHFDRGAFCCWGINNEEAPSPTQFELKTVDATANPYLALGAVIAAGLDGVRKGLELRTPMVVDSGTITAEEKSLGGSERLPATLGEAIEKLSSDRVLLDALGEDLAQAYLAVRKAEWETMSVLDLDAEVNVLLERY